MTALPRPVFVIGPERSGTGLLAWSLGQHPNVTPLLSTGWLAPLVPALALAHATGRLAERRSHLATRELDLDGFLAPFRRAAHQLALHGRSPAGHWVDHTPGTAFRAYELLRLFPDARFIHVFREVETAVPRLTNLEVSKLYRTYFNERQAYAHWRDAVRACLEVERAFGSETVLRVRHRELVESPEATLHRCLRFLGEPWDARCLRTARGHASDTEEARAGFRRQVESSRYAVAREAAALSREVEAEGAVQYPRDEDRMARLEQVFLEGSRPRAGAAGAEPLTRTVVEAARASLPAGARVLVVSRGDDALLELDGRRAEHFPQAEGGAYAGHHPADSAEAIAHLEALRERGAQFLLFPSTAFWWLDHYEGLRLHLEERYRVVLYRDDACVVYALDRAAGEGPRLLTRRGETPAPDPAPDAGRLRELDAQVARLEAELGAVRRRMRGWEVVREVRRGARLSLPAGARVLVVSRGDDALLELDGRRAEHFPQAEGGTYAGHHPADSAEAIAHLEALRERGAQFLLFPSTAFWWLDHYEGLRLHLEERYRLLVHLPSLAVFDVRRPSRRGSKRVPRPAALASRGAV